jgi:signal transduction histidine kinase
LYLIQEELIQKPDCKSEDIAQSVDAINENISYINKIVSDLQDYTRTLSLNIASIDLKEVLQASITSVPKMITTNLQVDPDVRLETDATYLKRILSNLVINAVQAMPNGGTLTLQAKTIDDRVMISVADTGIGIPDEAKPNLFKPLFTTKAKGQGLGLAVVKRLVEALGGNITFESQVGKGTTFIIELPAKKVETI